MVHGLKEEDFVVYEDNAPQKIVSFTARSSDSAKAGGTPAAAKPSPMIFLLEFTTTELDNQKRVFGAAARFVEKSLGPNDYVAVFLLGTDFRLLQEFTNDKTRLAAVLSRRDTGQLSLTQAGGSQPSATTSAASDAIQTINQSLASTGAASANANALTDASVGRVGAGASSIGSAINQRTTRDILTVLEGISRAVTRSRGARPWDSCLRGFVVGPRTPNRFEVQRAIDTVNKANVAVYTVDARGSTAPGIPRRVWTASVRKPVTSASGLPAVNPCSIEREPPATARARRAALRGGIDRRNTVST